MSFSRRLMTRSSGLDILVFSVWTASATVAPLQAHAQTAGALDATPDPDVSVDQLYIDEVIVQGSRQQFSSVDNIVPDISFGGDDIRALGTTDIGELIDAINAEIGSDSTEPPVILLNGRPVQSRREIRSFPSEAIRQVDVLPPDAALKFSSSANRRVLNFVLRDRFNAVTAELESGTSTEGGRSSGEGSANYLKIINNTRLALDVSYDAAHNLGETDRNIALQSGGDPFSFSGTITALDGVSEIDSDFSDLAGETVTSALVPLAAQNGAASLDDFLLGANQLGAVDTRLYRDLLPKTESLSIGGSYFRPVGERLSVTAAFNTDFSNSDSQQGLLTSDLLIPSDNAVSPFQNDITLFRYGDPILQAQDTSDLGASLSVFGDYPTWRWSLDSSYAKASSTTETNRSIDITSLQNQIIANDVYVNPFAEFSLSDLSQSEREQETFDLKGRINGRLLSLPAGEMTGSIGAEYSKTDLDSTTIFQDVTSDINLSRQVTELRAETSIPLLGSGASGDPRESNAGNASLRLNGALRDVEDIGTLTTYGAGLRWDATDKLSFEGSVDYAESPPSLSNIGNPVIVENNVRSTDFDTGQAITIDRITGGNPDLLSEEQRDMRLSIRYNVSRDLRFNTRFLSRRTENAITSFPLLTPQLAEAFPDRITRDINGEIISLDARPVNAFQTDEESLRTGFNWTKRFGTSQAGTGPTRQGPRAGASGRGAGGPGGPGGRSSSQVGLSVYHTWNLTDEFRFGETGPVFDLLNGAGLRSLGGESEHQIETRLSVRHKNIGGRLSANYETGTTQSLGNATTDYLTFDPLITADLRLYYDLGRRGNGRPVDRDDWRRNLRVSLDIDNLANTKQSVSDANGAVPFGYEKDSLDPLGRTVMFSIRKLFSTAPERGNRN